ncbi:WD repeat-containing protein 43 [Strongylocentrotus purpuratus]|uniref:Small-subunit processome Utp12 domain-containing protein n=1 Tax=Strongylocentrotus purpuratus TaxID=7668 RepID=A0A7M7PSD3_STRPU|nr:WD repeat-containing protein 43 [Strongylocentrotus purpuratus]
MATSRNRCCAFSVSDGYFATSSADGRLSIWDSKTGEVKQHYTPSSHLSSSCTCLAWQRKSRRSEENQKKKKRKSARVEVESTDTEVLSPTNLLALGTVAGSVLLYSVLKGDLHSKLDGGHDDTVNDVCWHPSDNTLYSCSEDRHIVEWDITNRTVRSKWKGDKTSVYSICICPGGSTLLSAGRTIQLWNLQTKAVLKKFTGHASPVTRLRVVPTLSPGSKEDDPLDSVEGLYFMSSAASDRIVNVWQVKSGSKDKASLASFAVPDEPSDFDVCISSDSEVYTSVVCLSGQVHIFQTVLNGRVRKPFQARHVVNVTTEGSKLSPARPIPILTSQLQLAEGQPQLKIAYGVNLKPAFESMSLESQEKEICLIRDDHLHADRRTDEAGDRVKRPLTSGDVTVLGPNNMAPGRPIQGLDEPSKSARKKAKRKSLRTELSMEDRLNALSIAQARPDIDKSQPPRADVMVTLLSQGLQSQDRELLDRVLKQDRAKVVTNTIKRLPIPLIVPLVQELARRMNTAPQSGLVIAHWTKEVLRERASYLMTCPELMLRLSHIYETINTRTSNGGKLSRLHGKLDLMLAQISSQDDTVEASHTDQALMLYEDESSDELDLMEDGLAIHSESEGEWDERSESSDMEAQEEDQADSNDSDSEDEEEEEDEEEDDDDET